MSGRAPLRTPSPPTSFPAAPSRCRAPRSPAPSRAARTRWPSWSWLSPRAATSRPSTSTTACAPDPTRRPGSWRRQRRASGRASRATACSVPPGPNLEARARSARFAVLPRGVATGHTMDDQAETILVNLLRGAGSDGLAGMEPGVRHPLLGLRRTETHAVCAAAGLVPVCDASNADPAFVRNRVRAELLPLCAAGGRSRPGAPAGPPGRCAARRGGAHGVAGRRRAARPGRRPGGGARAPAAGAARPAALHPRCRWRWPPAVAGGGRPHPRGGRGRRARDGARGGRAGAQDRRPAPGGAAGRLR